MNAEGAVLGLLRDQLGPVTNTITHKQTLQDTGSRITSHSLVVNQHP